MHFQQATVPEWEISPQVYKFMRLVGLTFVSFVFIAHANITSTKSVFLSS